jgi:hypothetical protein
MDPELINQVAEGASSGDGSLSYIIYIVIALLAGGFLASWKFTSNKSSKSRKEKLDAKTKASGQKINSTLSDAANKDNEIENNRKKAGEIIEGINTVINAGNIQIKQDKLEPDPKRTKERIKNKWDQI